MGKLIPKKIARLGCELIVTSTLFFLGGTCLAAPVESIFRFGVCVHLAAGRGGVQEVFDDVQQGGFNAWRDDFFWSGFEIEKGKFKPTKRLDDVKKLSLLSRANKIDPLVILAYGNKFYGDGGMPIGQSSVDAYANYAAAASKYLDDNVRLYEIWNEWNSGFGSVPRVNVGDVSSYIELLKAGYGSVHAQRENALVLGPATSGFDWGWIRSFISQGGLNYVDGFSVHAYTAFRYKKNPEGIILNIQKLHSIIASSSPTRRIPIFVTETGWPMTPYKHGVNEEKARDYWVRLVLMMRSLDYVGGVWWYVNQDGGISTQDMDANFGLRDYSGQKKQIYFANEIISKILKLGSDFAMFSIGKDVVAIKVTVTGKSVWIAWRVEPDALGWDEALPQLVPSTVDLSWILSALKEDGTPSLCIDDQCQSLWTSSAQVMISRLK